MRATSRAGSALAATTLAAFFAPGDAAEVTVKISYPDRDAGSTAARVLVATLVTLAVSVLVWMVLRRSASSTTRTSTSTTTAEQDVVNDNEEIDGWEVLTSDDDEGGRHHSGCPRSRWTRAQHRGASGKLRSLQRAPRGGEESWRGILPRTEGRGSWGAMDQVLAVYRWVHVPRMPEVRERGMSLVQLALRKVSKGRV